MNDNLVVNYVSKYRKKNKDRFSLSSHAFVRNRHWKRVNRLRFSSSSNIFIK